MGGGGGAVLKFFILGLNVMILGIFLVGDFAIIFWGGNYVLEITSSSNTSLVTISFIRYKAHKDKSQPSPNTFSL